MSESVTLAGDLGQTSQVGPLTMSTAGFGIEKNSVKSSSFPVAPLPRISIANPTTQDAALAAANDWVSSAMPAFQANVGNYIRSKGISSAFFSFSQEIMVSTAVGVKKQAVGFNVTVDQNGRPLYGAPKIIDPDPLYLQAVYTPMSTIQGLPSNWTYPNAGTIQYRVLDKHFNPITGYTVINTGGAFDEDLTDGVPADSKLKCLMDLRNPGCTGPIDITTIAGQVGASLAIVDYIRALEPDYTTLPDGSQQARGAISYDSRVWDCASFVNTGYFGYVLRMRAERYSMQPSAPVSQFQMLQQFGGLTISPTTPFQKSLPIGNLGGQSPASVVISPNPGDNSLWSVGDANLMRNVVYIAPVVAQGGDGTLSSASVNGPISMQQTAAVGSTREYTIGTPCVACLSTGQTDADVTFNVDNPQTLDEMAVIQEGFDDWMLITINGVSVFDGPFGGDMLTWVNGGSSNETTCANNGSGFTCQHTYPVTTLDAQNNPVPPYDGCTLSSYFNNETSLTEQSWSCPVNYNYCEIAGAYDYYGDGSGGPTGYSCRNAVCPDGSVQYMTNAGYSSYMPNNNHSNGCGAAEQSTSWRFNNYIDLRPYLHNGSNTLSMRVITYGGGEGFMKVRTQACGASLGLQQGNPPPVPPSGGSGGVTNTVINQAQR